MTNLKPQHRKFADALLNGASLADAAAAAGSTSKTLTQAGYHLKQRPDVRAYLGENGYKTSDRPPEWDQPKKRRGNGRELYRNGRVTTRHEERTLSGRAKWVIDVLEDRMNWERGRLSDLARTEVEAEMLWLIRQEARSLRLADGPGAR